MDVLHLCDRRACEKGCHPECKHTNDISHAKNFELGFDGVTMIETANPLVIFRPTAMLKKNVLDKIREDIMTQIKTGIVFCGSFIEPIVVDDSGTVIYDVVVTKREAQNVEA